LPTAISVPRSGGGSREKEREIPLGPAGRSGALYRFFGADQAGWRRSGAGSGTLGAGRARMAVRAVEALADLWRIFRGLVRADRPAVPSVWFRLLVQPWPGAAFFAGVRFRHRGRILRVLAVDKVVFLFARFPCRRAVPERRHAQGRSARDPLVRVDDRHSRRSGDPAGDELYAPR